MIDCTEVYFLSSLVFSGRDSYNSSNGTGRGYHPWHGFDENFLLE